MTKRWGLPDYPGKGGGRGHSTNWFYGGAERWFELGHFGRCRLCGRVRTGMLLFNKLNFIRRELCVASC